MNIKLEQRQFNELVHSLNHTMTKVNKNTLFTKYILVYIALIISGMSIVLII